MSLIELFLTLASRIQRQELETAEAYQVITGMRVPENLTPGGLSLLYQYTEQLYQNGSPLSVEFGRLVYLVYAEVATPEAQAVLGNIFGNILNKFGELSEAEIVISKAIRIFSQSDPQSAAILTGNLGWTMFRMGRFSAAIKHFNPALESALNHNDYRNELEWRLGLGFSHNSAGSYHLALKHCAKGLNLVRRTKMFSYEGKFITCQGLVYENTGELERAIECHEKALQHSLQHQDVGDEIQDYLNLGNLYAKLNSLSKAQNQYLKALKLAESSGDTRSHTSILANYGASLLRMGAVKEAQEICSRCLDEARRQRLAEIEDQALGNLAAAYLLDDQPSLAIPYLNDSLNRSKARGHTTSEIQDCLNLSRAYLQLGNIQKSLDYADYAFNKANELGDPSLVWKASWGLSKILRAQENSRLQAWEKLLLAIETVEKYRINIRSDENRIGFYTDKSTPYLDAVNHLLEDGLKKDALAFAERGKSRLLIDLLSETEFNEISKPLDADAVLSILRKTNPLAAFISIFSFPDKTVLFCVAASQDLIDPITLPLTQDEIKKWLLVWQELLNDEEPADIEHSAWKKESLPMVRQQLSWLDEHLMSHIRNWCDNLEISEVVISPHGLFHHLPLHAAFSPQVNRYFIEDKEISYIPAIQLFDFLDDESNSNRRAVVFGYSSKDKYLEHVETEVQTVAQMLQTEPVLEDATSERFIAEIEQGGIVHLASHAWFNELEPLKSSFEFSDSALTSRQIARLNLKGITLLVTAACDSGKVSPRGIGEALGFSRSWLIAGVRTIVCSRWVVWDYSSLELMKLFYADYTTSGNKLKSLIRAQRKLIAENTALSDPRAWATFILLGLT